MCKFLLLFHYNYINYISMLVKFIKHNQNLLPKTWRFKKLVLSSSGSWHDWKTPCQESGRMRGSVGSCPHHAYDRFLDKNQELGLKGHHRDKCVERRGCYCILHENRERTDRTKTSLEQCLECRIKMTDEWVRYCGRWYGKQPIDQEGRDMKFGVSL